eukprot:gene17492-17688_t
MRTASDRRQLKSAANGARRNPSSNNVDEANVFNLIECFNNPKWRHLTLGDLSFNAPGIPGFTAALRIDIMPDWTNSAWQKIQAAHLLRPIPIIWKVFGERPKMPINYSRRLTGRGRTKDANMQLGFILAFVAGAINAGGFLAVQQYTSHMTGIVSAMADHIALGAYNLVLTGIAALFSFLSGAASSTIMVNYSRRHNMHSTHAFPLLVEAGLLLCFGLLGTRLNDISGIFVSVTVMLLSFIMGLQNAVITKLSNAEIRTTHITGIITDIGIELGKLMYWNGSHADKLPKVRADRLRLIVLTSLAGLFLMGGVVGALGFKHVGYFATVPLALTLMILVIMIEFYYHPTPNPAKVALLLEETGLSYEVIPVDTAKGEQHMASFLAINPNGKVPAIVDTDGPGGKHVRVFDSTAILIYLAEKNGNFLGSAEDRPELLSWLLFIASGLGPFSGQSVHFQFAAPDGLDYAVNRYRREAGRHYQVLEDHLKGRQYIVGDTYTIADISAWGWLDRAARVFKGVDDPFASYPNLKRLFETVDARPAAMRARDVAKDHPFKLTALTDTSDYTPPKVWTWAKPSGGTFASINRPVAGPTHEKELPVGQHPLQLYSLGTPNGVKVTILLEELLALGHSGAEYDAWLINIREGDQFGSGFVEINPNSKIPALMDRSSSKPIRVFESGSILLYLAEKFGAFLPKDIAGRTETLNWLFWQMGSAPYLGGGFGHFYAYAPVKIEYAIDRFAMEVKRELDVLDRRLATSAYLAGDDYTIADIAVFSWYGGLVKGWAYDAAEFLSVQEYQNVLRWADAIWARPAVKRGRMVNRVTGDPSEQLRERHDASDFETKTQDKLI